LFSRVHVLAITIAFLIILLSTYPILSMLSHINHVDDKQSFTGTLEYLVVVTGSRSDNPLEIVSFECTFKIEITNNKLVRVSAGNFSIEELPDIISAVFKDFIRDLIIKWFNSFELFRKTTGFDKTYLSINGLIVEAYIVNSVNGVEYREANTGLFVGGDQFIQLEVTLRTLMYSLSYMYNLSIVSYLYHIQPPSILSRFAVVNPPVGYVRTITLTAAIVFIILAVITLARWEYYSIM
jgi:hypothetical protein